MDTLKTTFLLACLTSILLGFGGFLGGFYGMLIALGFAVVANFAAFWWSHQLILQSYNAQQVTESPAHGVYETVRSLTARNNLPMPDVFMSPGPAPNAFATGRSPENAAIAVTQGLSDMMSGEELEGVVAHELGHIINRDTLLSTVVAVLAGAIMNMSGMLRWFSIAGGRGGQRDWTPALQRFALAVFAPMAATLIQFGVSRSREFGADETGAQLAGSSSGLASALEKLEEANRRIPSNAQPATAHLFIVNPLSGSNNPVRWFSTHPPIEERIARLRAMAIQPGA